MKLRCVLFAAFLIGWIISGCASKDFEEPGIVASRGHPTARSFRSSFSEVWKATLAALQTKKYPLAASNKQAGAIETDWILGKSDRLYSGYGDSRIPYNIRYKILVQVRPNRRGVTVSIDNNEQYMSDSITAGTDFSGSLYQWIPTRSSTAKENALFKEIMARLGEGGGRRRSKP